MKRHGCIDCHLMEPIAGQWIGGRCPACTEIERRRQEHAEQQPTPPPKRDATADRLQGYLSAMAREYPDIWRNVDRLRALRGRELPSWPSWCFMPMAGAYAIASNGRNDAPPERLGAIAALAVLAAWRPTQGIYRFDPTLAEAVWDTPLDGEIPTEILHRIPEWCVYIETPGSKYLGADSPGFFAMLEHDANDHREELRLAIDDGAGKLMTAMPVHLEHGGIIAGIRRAQEEAARQVVKHAIGATAQQILSLPAELSATEISPRINLLLYLCSTNAEMVERGGVRLRPSKAILTKTKDGMRMFPAAKTSTWEVGWRIGAAIRAAREREYRRPGDGTHASPRPHVRRAHWHSFWTGAKAKPGAAPADRKLVLKWLPPMAVNVDEDAEIVPTVHPVQ